MSTNSTPCNVIGDCTSVKERFGTRSNIPVVGPLKLVNVMGYNSGGATVYLQIHNVTNTTLTVSGAGTAAVNQNYTVQSAFDASGNPTFKSADAGYLISYDETNFRWQITDIGIATVYYVGQTSEISAPFGGPWSQTWSPVSGAAGNPSVTRLFAVAPADGSVPLFSFPVQAGLGGTLSTPVDMGGVYCCWSTVALTKAIVVGSNGSIQIVTQ